MLTTIYAGNGQKMECLASSCDFWLKLSNETVKTRQMTLGGPHSLAFAEIARVLLPSLHNISKPQSSRFKISAEIAGSLKYLVE